MKTPDDRPACRDIVLVSDCTWDNPTGGNFRDLAFEMSKPGRVLFVNPLLSRRALLMGRGGRQNKRQNARELSGILEKINGTLWVFHPDKLAESINWIPNSRLFDCFNRINGRRWAACIRKAIEQLGFKDFILFNDSEMHKGIHLIKELRPAVSVYYCRDALTATPYWKRHGTRHEPALIAESDLAVANSEYLAEYCRRFNSRAINSGQGCDPIFFEEKDFFCPDLMKMSRPVIGFVGALTAMRLDPGIFEQVALARPDWNIVLVGEEDKHFQSSRLHGLKNIFFAGVVPPDTIPSWINTFDVCLNPQVINELTRGNYPRKVDEYLAMRKPVVATKTDAMAMFREHVYLAESREDFPILIEQALNEDSDRLREARRSFARTHSWTRCVELVFAAVDGVLAERRGRQ